jgi:serine/threonine protein kinase
MEWAGNGTLKDILDRPHLRPIDWDEIRKGIIICDIVMGMRYVHSRGLIHRDLKPANILLNARWRGLISDFGVSRLAGAEGPPTLNPGTVWYAAPELLIEGCQQTTKTDVFSFGLVLYEILTWYPAFQVQSGQISLMSVWTQLKSGNLPRLPERFGDFMVGLVDRCLSMNPDSRPSFDDILNEFRDRNFAIFAGANACAIAQAVSEVDELERNGKANL